MNPSGCVTRPVNPYILEFCLSSAAHMILQVRNLTVCCPARYDIVNVANNYAHC